MVQTLSERSPTLCAALWVCAVMRRFSNPTSSDMLRAKHSDACGHPSASSAVQGRKASAHSQQRSKGLAAKRRRGAAPKANGARTRQGVHTAAGELARAELGARAGSRWALLDTAAAEEHNAEILLRKKVLHSVHALRLPQAILPSRMHDPRKKRCQPPCSTRLTRHCRSL